MENLMQSPLGAIIIFVGFVVSAYLVVQLARLIANGLLWLSDKGRPTEYYDDDEPEDNSTSYQITVEDNEIIDFEEL
jgi:hypothetical protein